MRPRDPSIPDVIAFRNVLAHGYDAIEDETVYDNARSQLTVLLQKLRNLGGVK